MKFQLKKALLLVFVNCLTLSIHSQKYEAEAALYSGTVTTASVTGASGTCIRFENTKDYVKVKANITSAGTYKVYVAYASPFEDKNGYVSVNGNKTSVVFTKQSACSLLHIGNYNLPTGESTIEITPDWTWFYVDYVFIQKEGTDKKGFKVFGTKLLDANNKEFIMRGTNMAWAWYRSSGMAQLEAIARSGANAVRIVLSDGTKWSKDNAAVVASLIKKCEKLKMIAILEVHDHTGSNEQNGLIAAANYFVDIKDSLIGKEHTVIINIANEWCGEWNADRWKKGYEACIPILRNAGLNHCIMVDAAGYGQYPKSVHDYGTNVLNADPHKNVIFSIHMYEYSGNTSVVKSNIDKVINRNLALCIAEFGWYRKDGDVNEDLIMSYCREKNIGWLAWSWYGNGSDVRYLDMVKKPEDENSYYTASVNGQTCNWGKKIIDIWKNEAQVCSVFKGDISSAGNPPATLTDMIYPTKINDILHIKTFDACKIQITDLYGKIIHSSFSFEHPTAIPCASWEPGIYFVSIFREKCVSTYKVIR